MYILQQVPFMLLFCLQFLGEKSIFHSPIYICGALIFCLVIVHSSLTCSVFAFLDPYLEFSPVNWHVGLSVGIVKSKNKKAEIHLKIFM
jgi:hypothetical protein